MTRFSFKPGHKYKYSDTFGSSKNKISYSILVELAKKYYTQVSNLRLGLKICECIDIQLVDKWDILARTMAREDYSK